VGEKKIHADQSSQQVQSDSTGARTGLLYALDRQGRVRRERRQRLPTPKMLSFKPRKERKTVTQYDLEEFFLLEREMHESTADWKAKHDYILELLKAGATTEPGVHSAEIELKLKVR
jgi:hypothetical protein